MGDKLLTISPFNRVEGDLEIKVRLKDGEVVDAYASGVMFRGFEKLLRGRDPLDALVFTCRICGICSGSHSTAASNALRSALKIHMPPNAYLCRNVVMATETVMSHVTHFYAFFAVDFVNKRYSGMPTYKVLLERFASFSGRSYVKALRIRKKILEILGLFAGKWPHTLALQPGGTTRPVDRSEIVRAMGILTEFRSFIEESLLNCSLDRWLDNKSLTGVESWLGEDNHEDSDLGLFIRCGRERGLDRLGKGPCRFLSCGGYDLPDGTAWLKGGYFDGDLNPFDQTKITEHLKYSWFKGNGDAEHPENGTTEVDLDKVQAYSWAKAPRYDGRTAETGPLARMIVNQDPLAIDLVGCLGPNVFTRSLIRLHEAVKLVRQIGIWLQQIDPSQPFYARSEKVEEARGVGLTEAPRGILGHWITIEDYKIKNYQVITPSAWNLSPRGLDDTPGPVEQALIGTPVEDAENPIEVAHVIRSFDPCLFCTVHTLIGDDNARSFVLTTA